MGPSEKRRNSRIRRQVRVRRSVKGTDARPRISVYRSNRHIYVQVISDESGRTLASAGTLSSDGHRPCNVDTAKALGAEIAGRCKELSIGEAVFDRNGFRFHGRVKAVAEGAREAGLKI